MKTKKSLLILVCSFILISIISCKENKNTQPANAPEIKIKRFEQALFNLPIDERLGNELKKLRNNYAIFLDTDLDDSVKIGGMYLYLTNPGNIILYNDIMQKYPNLSWLEKELRLSLARYTDFFPKQKISDVYTYINSVEYNERIAINDTILLIGIDCFLGKDYSNYKHYEIPQYLMQRMDSNFITAECMKGIANNLLSHQLNQTTLLDFMIRQGKVLYFCDKTLEKEVPDETKIGYTSEQITWCKKNEGKLWEWILQQNLLHENDLARIRYFLSDGPTTNIFPDSPPRLADYIGWKIVQKYMDKNPDVTMQALFMNTNSQEILSKSKYKPKK